MPAFVLSLVSLHEWMHSKPVAWKARAASNKAPELTRAEAHAPALSTDLPTPWLLSCCLFSLGVEGNVQTVQGADVLTRSGLLPR